MLQRYKFFFNNNEPCIKKLCSVDNSRLNGRAGGRVGCVFKSFFTDGGK